MGLFGFGRKKQEEVLSPETLYKRGAELFEARKYTDAMPMLEKAAKMGHSGAQNHLGVDYKTGEGVAKDLKKAIYWYQKAIDQNNPKAMWNLAQLYKKGDGVAKDEKKYVSLLLRAAGLGHSYSQNSVGLLYQKGIGVAKNIEEAIKWYNAAADQGNEKAVYNLGLLYYNGTGVPRDLVKAREYWQKAVDMGDESTRKDLEEVEKLLGLEGKTVKEEPKKEAPEAAPAEEPKKAVPEAAPAEEKPALPADVLYAQGVELFQKGDWTAAIPLIEKAAQMGYSDAQNHLGVDYERGEGVPKDAQKAAYWYQKAADQNNPKALWNLGKLYKDGKGVPKDEKKGAELIMAAAQLGNAGAQNTLGILYEEGIGVAQNIEEAIKWYKTSEEQGRSHAAYNLGLIYLQGTGVPQDLRMAREYLQKAADRGHTTAGEYLEKLDQHLAKQRKPEEKQKPKVREVPFSQVDILLQEAVAAYREENFAVALEKFKAAANQSHPYAAYLAAELYLRPECLDYAQAELWAQKAQKAGDSRAKSLLLRIWRQGGNYYLMEADNVKYDYIVENISKREYDILAKEARELPSYKRLYSLAMDYLTKAAQQDDTWAMVSLTNRLYWDYFVDHNMAYLEKAAYWVERADQLGDRVAKQLKSWICGSYYGKIGYNTANTDYKKAVEYFRKGAQCGDRECMYNAALGIYTLNCNRVPPYRDRDSLLEALELAKQAKARGVSDADGLVAKIEHRL